SSEGEAPARAEAYAREGRRVALVAPAHVTVPQGVELIAAPTDPAQFARRLYALLRELDARGFDVAVVVAPDEPGLGHAVSQCRLQRGLGRVLVRLGHLLDLLRAQPRAANRADQVLDRLGEVDRVALVVVERAVGHPAEAAALAQLAIDVDVRVASRHRIGAP